MGSEPRVLVVGATGILRPAVLQLARSGRTVVAVARGRVDLTTLEAAGGQRVEVVPIDLTRSREVAAATATGGALAGPLDAALVYQPRTFAPEFDRVLAHVHGRVVRLLTSAAGAPDVAPWDDGDRRPDEARLLLGWTGPDDAPRWHTPEEVSAAALEVAAHGRDAVLGRVRPWAGRPH